MAAHSPHIPPLSAQSASEEGVARESNRAGDRESRVQAGPAAASCGREGAAERPGTTGLRAPLGPLPSMTARHSMPPASEAGPDAHPDQLEPELRPPPSQAPLAQARVPTWSLQAACPHEPHCRRECGPRRRGRPSSPARAEAALVRGRPREPRRAASGQPLVRMQRLRWPSAGLRAPFACRRPALHRPRARPPAAP